MQLKLPFYGSPAEFGVAAEELSWELNSENRRIFFWADRPSLYPFTGDLRIDIPNSSVSESQPIKPDANPVVVKFWEKATPKGGKFPSGYIRARKIKDGESLLTVQVDDDDWLELKPVWELLANYLQESNLIGVQTPDHEKLSIEDPKIAEAVNYYLENKHRGYTQEQAAKKAGVSVSHFRRHIPPELREVNKKRTPKNKNERKT